MAGLKEGGYGGLRVPVASSATVAEEFGAGPGSLFFSSTLLADALDQFPHKPYVRRMVFQAYWREVSNAWLGRIGRGMAVSDKLYALSQGSCPTNCGKKVNAVA